MGESVAKQEEEIAAELGPDAGTELTFGASGQFIWESRELKMNSVSRASGEKLKLPPVTTRSNTGNDRTLFCVRSVEIRRMRSMLEAF